MKKLSKNLLSNSSGFTLIELMVVVAIIGILAAIAVPNFNTFQAKARQAEAKTGLAAIFTAEATFATENNTYSSTLAKIGYVNTAAKRYYTIGFGITGGTCLNNSVACSCWAFTNSTTTDATGKVTASIACTASSSDATLADGLHYFKANLSQKAGQAATVGTDLATYNVITQNTFTAVSSGYVSNNTAAPDIWTIDHNKNIANVSPGL